MPSKRILSEIFVIPEGENFIIYAPLKKLAFLVNRQALEVITDLKEGRPIAGGEKPAEIVRFLTQHKLLEESSETIEQPALNGFAPTRVTLFPTSDCNLRCVYCYASGGERPRYMQWEVAQAALDCVMTAAGRSAGKRFVLGFHGGGEPTLGWDILQRAVRYARRQAQERGLSCAVTTALNAVLSPAKRRWIIEHVNSATISLDGPKDIQDSQRPLAGGRGSFAAVMRSLKEFDAAGFDYGIRATITSASVARMSELVDFFADTVKTTRIQFEPLFACGRCSKTNWSEPDPELFLREFVKAQRRAKQRGFELRFSGARPESLTDRFCEASSGNFCVTPEGWVTSCFEVSDPGDPRSAEFFFGRYDPPRGSFVFDLEKLNRLRTRTVQHMPACAGCFCKWHCAGDCLAKAIASSGDLFQPDVARCWLNRELTKARIIDLLEAAPAINY